jgi:outer membrane protein TolC
MKRLYTFLIVVGLSSPSLIYGQQTSFTLQQCIDYAIKNSINAQNAELDQRIASSKVKETVGLGLPQISATGSVIHNEQLQRFFTRYDTSASSFIKLPASVAQGLRVGDVIAAQNFFQLKNSATAQLSINQLIFSGSYIVGLQASRTYKELSEKSAIQTREQITLQVTKAFYNVIINRERAELFESNIARLDSLLKNTIALNKNGFAESIDVDRIQVNLNNLVTERDKFLKINELSTELLKFQMNYPMDQSIEVVGSVEGLTVEPIVLDDKNWDYKNRPDYRTLETNKRLQELNIKNLYAGALPSISVFGNLGYNTQSADLGGLFVTNTNYKDNGTLGPDKYYSYSQFGLNVNVPIFSGLQRHQRIQQEKLNLLKIDNGFKNLKQAVALETKQATVNFQNAISSLGSQRANMNLASKVAKVTKIKYEQGVGSNLEVVDAENSLRQAQTNYYNAMYDAMVAKVDLDKAYGRIIPQNVNPN